MEHSAKPKVTRSESRQSRLAIASVKIKEKQSNHTNPTGVCFTFISTLLRKDIVFNI
jgi:hypothetical protein